jgi:hypothetical protein
MALGNYAQFFLTGLGDIGTNLEAMKNKQESDKSWSNYNDWLHSQGNQNQPQTISNLGANNQPLNILPPGYTNNIKQAESGGNLNATNPNSTATGPYQFTDGTWADLGKQHPELNLTPNGRTDPAQNERAIAAFTQDNAKTLYGQGIPINPGTLYAAHFLGAGGAVKALSADNNAPLTSTGLSPEVFKANPFLNGMTVGQFKDFAAKRGGNPKGGYQVASNDQTMTDAQPVGLQAPPTISNQVQNPQSQNPVAQAFSSLPQQQQLPPQPSPSLQQNMQPQQVAQNNPQQIAQSAPQGQPPQYTPQVNQNILPPRDIMLQLFKSPETRPIAIALAQAAQKGLNPGFSIITSKDDPRLPPGTVIARDNSTGDPKVLIQGEPQKNTVVPMGSTVLGPDGKPVYTNNTSDLTEQTVDVLAHQLVAGDQTVKANMGFGAYGTMGRNKILNRATEIMQEQGISGEEIALRNAEFQGLKSSERTLGTRSATLSIAADEAKGLVPIAIDLSDKVSRWENPTINKILENAQTGVGGENVVKLAQGINALANTYSKAVNPTGVVTDDMRNQVLSLLNIAYTKGQFKASANQMMVEINRIIAAPANAKASLGAQFLKEHGITPPQENSAQPSQSNAAQSGQIQEGATATNPTTGQKVIFKNGQWNPLQ